VFSPVPLKLWALLCLPWHDLERVPSYEVIMDVSEVKNSPVLMNYGGKLGFLQRERHWVFHWNAKTGTWRKTRINWNVVIESV